MHHSLIGDIKFIVIRFHFLCMFAQNPPVHNWTKRIYLFSLSDKMDIFRLSISFIYNIIVSISNPVDLLRMTIR